MRTRPTMIRDTSATDRPLTPRPMHRRLVIGGAAIALIGGAVFLAPSLRNAFSTSGSVSETRLGTAAVERGTFVRDIAAEGKVVAAVSPTLYAPSAGAATLRVHAGDTVRKGEVLAVIDSPDLSAKLAQETSNGEAMRADVLRAQVDAQQQRATLQREYDNARIDHTTAGNDLSRQQRAFEAGAVAGMQVDHAKDTLEKARLTLANTQAGLGMKEESLKFDVRAKQLALERQLLLVKDLQRQLADLQVRSPVDGQVGQLFIAPHANVAKDAQLLSVIDLSALEVQVQVAESFARDLGIGMPGEISGNGQSWKGKVSAISPEVIGNEVAARLRFDGQTPGQLRQNQRLSVRVLLDRRDDVLTVRRGSFADEGGGTQAYVLVDGIAERRPVRLGARSLDKVEVLQGLEVGDVVVISGADAFKGAPRVSVSR